MRVPQYQAWNPYELRMYDVTAIEWSAASPEYISKLQLLAHDSHTPKSVPAHAVTNYMLREYTGLIDKNRKKIWEGDIVRWWGDQYTITFSEHDGNWILKDDRDDWECPSLYAVRSPEQSRIVIIGNIYENKEESIKWT